MASSSSGGGVRLRPDGRWEGRYMAAGRRHSIFAKTKREAQERLRHALLEADHGIRPIAGRTTVAQYLEEWLETSVATRCRPRTLESYRDTVRRYIVPAIGRRPLAKLEPADVGRMIADLTARGTLSPTTVRYARDRDRDAPGRAPRAAMA